MGGTRPLESFVARIWLEPGPNGEPRWRGHIRHVQDNREAYFRDLEDMRRFLESVTGVPGPGSTAPPGGADDATPAAKV